MQYQFISLLALVAAVSAAPLVARDEDRCGNSDPTRACLFVTDAGGAFRNLTVPIGQQATNIQAIVDGPGFSLSGLELETVGVDCTATCDSAPAFGQKFGVQTLCSDDGHPTGILSGDRDFMDLAIFAEITAITCNLS